MSDATSHYTYEIEPRPIALGGGWRLRLLERGEEVGGGVFPLPENTQTGAMEQAIKDAKADAETEAQLWLASREHP